MLGARRLKLDRLAQWWELLSMLTGASAITVACGNLRTGVLLHVIVDSPFRPLGWIADELLSGYIFACVVPPRWRVWYGRSIHKCGKAIERRTA